MPMDSYGLDRAIKGLLGQVSTIDTGAIQVRIHSGDPGAGNSNVITYTGLTSGVDVAGWSFSAADGTATPTGMTDWPVPPTGFTTVAASWVSYWRGTNRVGKDRIVDGSGNATSVNIVAQQIPRLTAANFVWTVPAA